MLNPLKRKIAGITLAILAFGMVYYAGSFALFALNPMYPESKESAVIEVHKGEGPHEITRALVGQKVMSDPDRFILLGRIMRQWKRIKAGEYKIDANMSPLAVLAVITSGISVAHPVTVREGENIYEIADDLQSKGLASREAFLKLCQDPKLIESLGLTRPTPPTLEGYLFPDTYFFNKTLSTEEMIRQMVRHFISTWTPQFEEKTKQFGLSRHQIITLASIIEKETGAPQERALISSVFHNRLRKKMKLQSDPTTIYGVWNHFHGKIHRRDLDATNPYNTYTIDGLPIGPISNPGKDAIRAALFPDQSDYLYFVSHNDGTHQFSKTFEEHNNAVRKYQLDPKAREGKSWRDLTRQKSANFPNARSP